MGQFCGLQCDYLTKTVCLVPKTIRKSQAWLDRINTSPVLTAGEVAELFGLLFYASPALKINVAKYYFAMKTYRRIASRLSKNTIGEADLVNITKCIREQLREWLAQIVRNTPQVPEQVVQAKYIMYSDASLSGWGCVLIRESDQLVLSVGDKWEMGMTKNINTLEALAILEGLRAFSQFLRNSSVELRVDNTSALSGVRRGYARAKHLNEVVDTIQQQASQEGVHISNAFYVSTKINPADTISRGQHTDGVTLMHVHDDVNRWLLANGSTISTGDGASGRSWFPHS